MIFQEPMTSLNPLHTIEKQVNEVLFVHKRLCARRRARADAGAAATWSGSPTPSAGSAPIRTSSRAASASA